MARPPKFADEHLLDRAVDLLWRDGADAVTIRDLEVAVGVKAPSIYRRFENREELLARGMARYVDRVIGRRIHVFLDGSDTPVEGLRRFFTSVLEPHPDEPVLRGCFLATSANQAAGRQPAVAAEIEAGMRLLERSFRLQLERAADAGQLAEPLDLDAVASSLLISFQGLLVLVRSRPVDQLSALRAGIDATVDALLPTPPLPISQPTETE